MICQFFDFIHVMVLIFFSSGVTVKTGNIYYFLFRTLPEMGLLLILYCSRLRLLWAPRALLIIIKEDFDFLNALKAGKSVVSHA